MGDVTQDNNRKPRIWLLKGGEPLPGDPHFSRWFRMGFLADQLAKVGTDVTWWTVQFDHLAKRHRSMRDALQETISGVHVRYLKGRAYESNVSVARILHQCENAQSFLQLAAKESPPDVIVCAVPTPELMKAAARYSRRHGVPLILDVRDLWPDAIIAPMNRRPLLRWLVKTFYGRFDRYYRCASRIVGISDSYLDWAQNKAGKSSDDDLVVPIGYIPPSAEAKEVQLEQNRLKSMGVNPSKRIFWFVGVMERSCDLTPFIEAFQYIKNDNAQLVISGDGTRRVDFESAAQGLDNVIFTGAIGAPGLLAMGQWAHVGVAAYAQGAQMDWPNKYFEYLHFGLPIITTLQGSGTADLENQGCSRVVGVSPGDIRNALDELMVDENLRALCENVKLFNESAGTIEENYIPFVKAILTDAKRRRSSRQAL